MKPRRVNINRIGNPEEIINDPDYVMDEIDSYIFHRKDYHYEKIQKKAFDEVND